MFLADRQICVPSQYLCNLETDGVQLAFFLFVIFAGTDIKNITFSQFSKTGIFFLYFRALLSRTILKEPEPGGRNRYDMTWNHVGRKIYCTIYIIQGGFLTVPSKFQC